MNRPQLLAERGNISQDGSIQDNGMSANFAAVGVPDICRADWSLRHTL